MRPGMRRLVLAALLTLGQNVMAGEFVVVSDQRNDVGLSERELFMLQIETLIEMHANGEIKRSEAHQVMKKYMELRRAYYGCSLRDLDRVVYDECVFAPLDSSPGSAAVHNPEGGGGWSASDYGKVAIGYAGGKIGDRIADRVMDHAERKVTDRVERDRVDNENRRRVEGERNNRCAHATPSYREGDCAR